jgi:predicted MarR family transcription regulator
MGTGKAGENGRDGTGIDTARSLLHDSQLAQPSSEDAFIEFEFALHHIVESFGRWSSTLHDFVSGESLPVHDVSVLQTVRMNERPKSAAEIGKFLNRDDSSNILYSLRKLDKAGMIRKSGGSSRQTTYQVTEHGRDVTDRYAAMRREVLLPSIDRLAGPVEDVSALTRALWQISGLYEQAARTMAMTRMLQTEPERPARQATRAKLRKDRSEMAQAVR